MHLSLVWRTISFGAAMKGPFCIAEAMKPGKGKEGRAWPSHDASGVGGSGKLGCAGCHWHLEDSADSIYIVKHYKVTKPGAWWVFLCPGAAHGHCSAHSWNSPAFQAGAWVVFKHFIQYGHWHCNFCCQWDISTAVFLGGPSCLPLPSKHTKFETEQTNSQRWTFPNGEHTGSCCHPSWLWSPRASPDRVREARCRQSPCGSDARVHGYLLGTLHRVWCQQETVGCRWVLHGTSPAARCVCRPAAPGLGGWMGSLWLEEQLGALRDPVVIHLYYEYFMPAYKEYVVQAPVNAR